MARRQPEALEPRPRRAIPSDQIERIHDNSPSSRLPGGQQCFALLKRLTPSRANYKSGRGQGRARCVMRPATRAWEPDRAGPAAARGTARDLGPLARSKRTLERACTNPSRASAVETPWTCACSLNGPRANSSRPARGLTLPREQLAELIAVAAAL